MEWHLWPKPSILLQNIPSKTWSKCITSSWLVGQKTLWKQSLCSSARFGCFGQLILYFEWRKKGRAIEKLRIFFTVMQQKSAMELFCALSHKYILKFQLQICVSKRELALMTSKLVYFYVVLFSGCLQGPKDVLSCTIHSKGKNKGCKWNSNAVLCNPKDKCWLRYSSLYCSHYNPSNNLALVTVFRARIALDWSRKSGRYNF